MRVISGKQIYRMQRPVELLYPLEIRNEERDTASPTSSKPDANEKPEARIEPSRRSTARDTNMELKCILEDEEDI